MLRDTTEGKNADNYYFFYLREVLTTAVPTVQSCPEDLSTPGAGQAARGLPVPESVWTRLGHLCCGVRIFIYQGDNAKCGEASSDCLKAHTAILEARNEE